MRATWEMLLTRLRVRWFPGGCRLETGLFRTSLFFPGLDQELLADLDPVAHELIPALQLFGSRVELPGNAEQRVAALNCVIDRLLDQRIHRREQPALGSCVFALGVLSSSFSERSLSSTRPTASSMATVIAA